MAETVGIPEARDSRGTVYGRAAIDADPCPFDRNDLVCGGCTLPVTAAKGHPRRVPGGGETWVSACFRRWPRQDRTHDEGCDFDFERRATELISDSRGTLTKNGEHYELRLPQEAPSPQDAAPERSGGTHGRIARLQVNAASFRLAPTIRTAAGILRLLRRFAGSDDAVARFRAVYGKKRLTWEQFCRPASDAESIMKHLRGQRDRQHPLAVHGTVGLVSESKQGSSFSLLDAYAGTVLHEGQERQVRVTVRSRNRAALRGAQQGDHWLAYGQWSYWVMDHVPRIEIQLWIDTPSSLVTWR
ncbi:hypothetical protein [Brachybacterium paraconglomeratum]|uniref:hypothetical protein n=1 Tax=Brachybacterium paraconglomeratum TaxID=173362 RepID=UPI0022B06ACA|nr:hypothetical protein [Brachybacterium paraconglomeratum]MCZ4326731.1 hypothetical protein [Brachybacterium paraconglomeratum]